MVGVNSSVTTHMGHITAHVMMASSSMKTNISVLVSILVSTFKIIIQSCHCVIDLLYIVFISMFDNTMLKMCFSHKGGYYSIILSTETNDHYQLRY